MDCRNDRISLRAPRTAFSAFARQEEGSLAILGLFMFILMLVSAGIALDIMRNERARAELQVAVDGAVLAAADLDQRRDPKLIVREHLKAAGFDPDIATVNNRATSVRERNIEIQTAAVTRNLFLGMLNYDELYQPVSTAALERRSKLEVSLVVDISRSMEEPMRGGGTKIQTLRREAKAFVSKLLRGSETLTTVSLIPYNETVNMGQTLASVFDLSEEHDFARCAVFDDRDDDFRETGIDEINSDGYRLIRRAYFDYRTYSFDNPEGLIDRSACPPNDDMAIIPWSNDEATLLAAIDNLKADYSTAIDHGVKWGVALLDPSSRDELQRLATDMTIDPPHRVDPSFVGRPVDYDETSTTKLLIVMTDGESNNQFDLHDDYKDGPSDIWVYRLPKVRQHGSEDPQVTSHPNFENGGTDANGNFNGWFTSEYCRSKNVCRNFYYDNNDEVDIVYSVRSPYNGKYRYYSTYAKFFGKGSTGDSNGHAHGWHDEPYGLNTNPRSGPDVDPTADGAFRLTWPQVWATLATEGTHRYSTRSYLLDQIARDLDNESRNALNRAIIITQSARSGDENLRDICTAARRKGIEVYSIAFMAPPRGQRAMLDCVGVDPNNPINGDASRYYNVGDDGLGTAFDGILASFSRLRLVQ